MRLLIVLLNEFLFQNIELKVEVESLKKELEEKQQLLDKALWVFDFILQITTAVRYSS